MHVSERLEENQETKELSCPVFFVFVFVFVFFVPEDNYWRWVLITAHPLEAHFSLAEAALTPGSACAAGLFYGFI